MLYRSDFTELRRKVIQLIVISIFISLFFLCLLIITFRYLQIKSLSIIPIFSLLILAGAIVILTLNFIRLNIVNSVISGDLKINKKFLRLLMICFKAEEIQDTSTLHKECEECCLGYAKSVWISTFKNNEIWLIKYIFIAIYNNLND